MSTKSKASCPHCRKSFEVPTEYLGKRATCASCKNKFVVSGEPQSAKADFNALGSGFESAFPDWMTNAPVEMPVDTEPDRRTVTPPKLPDASQESVMAELLSPPTAKPAPVKKRDSRQGITAAIVGCVALVAGYFIGREHLKYEMRTAVQQAFKTALPGLVTSVPKVSKPSGPKYSMGMEIRKPGFSIALTDAVIGKAKLKAYARDEWETDDDYLTLTIAISNTEDRKKRTFSDDSSAFKPSHLTLEDDVGNRIRGVDFGFSHEVVGAVKSFEDIPPGGLITHSSVFSLPLPKTKYVVLTIDLKCIDGEGQVQYQVPIEQIKHEGTHLGNR